MKKIQILFVAFFAMLFGTNQAISMPLIDDEDNLDNLLGLEVQLDESGELVNEEALLAGLGRLFKASSFNRPQAVKFYNRIMSARRSKRRINHLKTNVTKGQHFIVGNLAKLPVEMQADIKNKTTKFQDSIMYLVSEKDSISGIAQLIDSNTKLTTGYSSFEDLGKVPAGKVMAVDYFTLERNQFDPSTQTVFNVNMGGAGYYSDWAGCDIEILQDNISLLRVPISALTEGRILKGANARNQNGYNLKQRLLIVPGKKVQFNIITPDNLTLTPASGRIFGIRVNLYSDGTTVK